MFSIFEENVNLFASYCCSTKRMNSPLIFMIQKQALGNTLSLMIGERTFMQADWGVSDSDSDSASDDSLNRFAPVYLRLMLLKCTSAHGSVSLHLRLIASGVSDVPSMFLNFISMIFTFELVCAHATMLKHTITLHTYIYIYIGYIPVDHNCG